MIRRLGPLFFPENLLRTPIVAASGAALLLALPCALLVSAASELGWVLGDGGVDNNGLGTPLSMQELRQLQLDERLGRTTLDAGDDAGGGDGRGKGSAESRREEEALASVVFGRDLRQK